MIFERCRYRPTLIVGVECILRHWRARAVALRNVRRASFDRLPPTQRQQPTVRACAVANRQRSERNHPSRNLHFSLTNSIPRVRNNLAHTVRSKNGNEAAAHQLLAAAYIC